MSAQSHSLENFGSCSSYSCPSAGETHNAKFLHIRQGERAVSWKPTKLIGTHPMSLHLTAFWEIPNHFVINFQFCQEKVAFHWQTTCCPHTICESVLAESSVISKNIFQAHFLDKTFIEEFFKKSWKIVLRWRCFIPKIANINGPVQQRTQIHDQLYNSWTVLLGFH